MKTEAIVYVIGLGGQLLFSSRFIVQWIASEKKKESVIPVSFWFLSLFGGLTLLTYAILRKDPVFILGQSLGSIVYVRNLYFIYKKKATDNSIVEDSGEDEEIVIG